MSDLEGLAEQIARKICGLSPDVIAAGRMGRASPDKSAFATANRILDLKHNGLSLREILQKWDEGKLVELAKDQSLPTQLGNSIHPPPAMENAAAMERDMWARGWRRIA